MSVFCLLIVPVKTIDFFRFVKAELIKLAGMSGVTFSGGLQLCTSGELYSYYYTNAIFQENQEELEIDFPSRNKRVILF